MKEQPPLKNARNGNTRIIGKTPETIYGTDDGYLCSNYQILDFKHGDYSAIAMKQTYGR